MAFPGQPGDLVNLRELEQMVDQLNRLPSNQAQMELKPGKNVGGSEVEVTNTAQKPWRAGLSRNNGGQRSTGEQQMGLTFDWDNPLGLADQLSLRGNHDVMSDHQRSAVRHQPRAASRQRVRQPRPGYAARYRRV